jgi:hypothetical protein
VNPLRVLRKGPRRAFAAGLTVCFCVFVIGFFGSANLSQGFDNSQFHFMRYTLEESEPLAQEYFDSWSETMTAIDPDDGDLLEINPVNWAWRFGVVAFTLMGMRFLFHRRESVRIFSGGVICLVIVQLMVANSVCAYGYNIKAYSVEQQEIDEICAINSQLAARDDTDRVFVVLDDGNTKNNNLVDTYIQDGPGNYRYLTPDELDTFASASSDPALTGDLVRYLLVNKKQDVTVTSRGAKPIGGAGNDGRFILYEIPDNEPLHVNVKPQE